MKGKNKMKDKKREHLVKIIKCYLETSKSL